MSYGVVALLKQNEGENAGLKLCPCLLGAEWEDEDDGDSEHEHLRAKTVNDVLLLLPAHKMIGRRRLLRPLGFVRGIHYYSR